VVYTTFINKDFGKIKVGHELPPTPQPPLPASTITLMANNFTL
jgi:hypothetical protein